MSKYRRLFEPEKGVPAPEVMIDKPQEIDLDDIGVWRHKNNLETIAALTNLMKPCYCYEPLMQVRIENLQIESDDGLLPLRIYLPEGKGPHPIMIFIHGGGWTMNNLDVYDYVPRYFAKYGDILVITPDYRLAPENPFRRHLMMFIIRWSGLRRTHLIMEAISATSRLPAILPEPIWLRLRVSRAEIGVVLR